MTSRSPTHVHARRPARPAAPRGRAPHGLLAALLLALAPGCNLIASDIDDFTLRLPEKPFMVDTADWEMSADLQGTFPAVPCPAVDCAAQASMYCEDPSVCGASCDGTNCQVDVTISLYQTFNLAMEAPELAMINEQAGIKVTIDAIAFKVTENTLNVEVPPLDVYMAPATVVEPGPSAKLVGTIAALPPGVTATGSVAFAPGGRENMEAFMSDFRTPFNVIVTGKAVVQAGTPIPEGRLVGAVTATAHADAF